ncbi:MAG TPA: bacteriohemerythrin [Azospirillaceae bacterium]|nr:bacteriohemerythrin [Azospirillaceae bacterium]
MPSITWTEEFSVGVALMDQEHQELLRLLNEFADAVKAGRAKGLLSSTLDRLAEYTAGHLSREEKLLHEHGYPDLFAHRQQHRDLMRQLGDLQGRLQRGATMSLSLDLLSFLVTWLTDHIQNSDREYGKYLRGVGVS